MTKVGLIKFLLIILIVPPLQAQKVKYKDIFGLLSSKQYEEAEPFLKKYLKENDDNPSAFLFMGIIYQEKSLKNDILKQLPVVIKNTDSAVYFFNKAKSTINEKEIKRNDEYYQAYNRRDLRTGEFGVKLSDIQFDLEKKTEALHERLERIKMTNYYFRTADSLYKKCNALYRSLQQPYSSLNEFFLRSNDSTIIQLNNLVVRFDSALKFTENYIASVQNVSSTQYRPSIRIKPVENFKTDGVELDDFYQNDLMMWNYRTFSTETKEIVEKEIFPLRNHLVSFDIELNKLGEKLSADSVSVRSDITNLTEKLLSSQLKKFDPDPLPLNVFSMKMANLEYRSIVLEDQPLCDSLDVHLQLKLAEKERFYLNRLDSLAGMLLATDINAADNYSHFITSAYNSPLVLKNYTKGLKEFAEREIEKSEEVLASRRNDLRWLVVDSVSIPLFSDSTVSMYNPLIVEDERYTLGLHYKDTSSVSGYFYSITPARRPDIKINFPVDSLHFKKQKASALEALSSDSNNQVYYVLIYSASAVQDKYPSTIAKIYRSDGLSWANNFSLDFIPEEIEYRQDTGELWVKSSDATLILDKSGKSK